MQLMHLGKTNYSYFMGVYSYLFTTYIVNNVSLHSLVFLDLCISLCNNIFAISHDCFYIILHLLINRFYFKAFENNMNIEANQPFDLEVYERLNKL